MAQVKFYATTSASYNAIAEKDNGGIYFVQGGELYKGSARFGLGRVTVSESTASIEGAARGDIVVTGSGAGWVFDGTNWQSIGGDVSSLQSMWRADISASLAGLSVGEATSYITNITQNADGSVTANAVAFPALDTGDSDGEVKLGTDAAKVSGWDTVKTDISNLQAVVSYSGDGDSVVTATTGNFTNLNVSDTATFSATTVSATTLTIGGSTVEQLADKQIAAIASVTQVSASNGITVGVTTQSGSVTAVSVDATAFGNVMSFKGVVTALPSEDNVSGDIVVIGTPEQGESLPAGLVTGQEYIYDGTKWELIGDQNTYALNAYTSSATVFTGATTVPTALNAAGAAIDALKSKTDAYVGGSASDADQGVSVTVSVDAATLAPSVDVVVTSATLFSGLDADVSSSENNSIQVGVTQVDGVVTGVTADLLWLGADGEPLA